MLSTIKGLVRMTLSNPRAAVAVLLRIALGQGVLLQLASIVVVLGVAESYVYSVVSPVPGNPLIDGLMGNPVLLAVVQFMGLMLSVLAIYLVGRAFGGTGTFEQSLLISIWLQFYMLIVQTGLIVIALLSSGLAQALDSAAFVYMIWLLVNFIAILHGFTSLWKVFAGLVATSLAASFVIIFLLMLAGIGVKGY